MAIRHSLYKEAGRITVDHQTCNRCGECARTCPTEVLRLVEGSVQIHPESMFGCIACGHCMMVCPTESIQVNGRGLAPSDLVPLPPPGERAQVNALAALMLSRRSVRRFKAEEPSLALLQQIVAMAAMGPMGIPPWDVGCVIVRGRDRVQALAGEIVASYAGLLKVLKPWLLDLMRPLMPRHKYDQMRGFIAPLARAYVDGRNQGRDLLFYDAPAVLVFHHSPHVEPAEAMIACTYAMLAAESLGLGTTMIGAAAPMIMRKKELCRQLGIPLGNSPAITLIIGLPAVRFRRGVRRHFISENIIE